MRIVSACLLGIKCRYDGKSKPIEKIVKLLEKEILIPICPEQLGGLPTPRIPQEIQGYSGKKVLDGKCNVMNKYGGDVTRQFIQGAYETLNLARLFDIDEAILKQKSPSCGCGKTYDGTFSNTLISGDGVTTALLKRNNINVLTEDDIK